MGLNLPDQGSKFKLMVTYRQTWLSLTIEGHELHDRTDVLNNGRDSQVLHSADSESESNSCSTILRVCLNCCHTDGSLVPRPLPDFISQLWRKIGRRPGTNTTSRTGNGGLDSYVMWTRFHNDGNVPTQYAASTPSDRTVKFV